MAISFDNALGMHESALKLRAERASVLSSNLVNADTPGYKARDFDFQQALSTQMSGSGMNGAGNMNATRNGHIQFSDGMSRAQHDYMYRVPAQPSIDGNTVEENVEHSEFMKNSLEFQSAFTFLNSKFKGLTKAIRGD